MRSRDRAAVQRDLCGPACLVLAEDRRGALTHGLQQYLAPTATFSTRFDFLINDRRYSTTRGRVVGDVERNCQTFEPFISPYTPSNANRDTASKAFDRFGRTFEPFISPYIPPDASRDAAPLLGRTCCNSFRMISLRLSCQSMCDGRLHAINGVERLLQQA
jgi:hypothetical protein